jgi:uncharacterized phage-associated protein
MPDTATDVHPNVGQIGWQVYKREAGCYMGRQMAYDARQIANWFIERAAQDGRALTIMSLLKLTYIAHGWNLEVRDEPLISNKIEAWQYGPVIPDVYNTYRPQGVAISKPVEVFETPKEPTIASFLEEIYTIYGRLPAFKLSELTHVPGGPWDVAKDWGGWFAEIPNDLIKSHYVSKRRVKN